ncbi:hypothetical protein BU26DRAFT_517881 [Trematosphaeria pertusa]|uniref:CsbD-like domain-containing protein n=1 Tax=Trematosphaeria pertusa TaxID=390896 RepID=A0A6A6IL89_9PLEO|nr:uncharacterized protein BU26DRAFT_517881 [Trematosphaeria pertusa]KAF2251166.1 hypothetical protein BU26DRAFT_517881 [Trematosphaeria pertusa]
MSSNNNENPTSTLQSVVDQASAAIQSGIGALTGNPGDKKVADDKRAKADVEHDLSHSAAKAGPFTVNASGGVAKDDPNRTQGSWNQTVGSAKEAVGNLVGAEGLKQEGIRQNREGKGQEAQGQMSDLGKGIQDRLGGTIGGAVAGLTGNQAQRDEAQRQHDEGKARQRGVEADLQKENPQ